MKFRALVFILIFQTVFYINLKAQPFSVLVFTKTAGYYHSSIPDGVKCIKELGQQNQFNVVVSDDANQFVFSDEYLKKYAVVVFLNTTRDIFNEQQQLEFQKYIHAGGGFVGIHAAADTELDWPWYGQLVGAHFNNHSNTVDADVHVSDKVHLSTSHLPSIWKRKDEWYDFQWNPRGKVHVLATLDERTYNGGEYAGKMGWDHPIAWCHEFEGGRAWYTAGGHTSESFVEPAFRQHILGGILYAAGRDRGKVEATVDANFEVSVLDSKLNTPMAFTVLPDNKVLYIELIGVIKVYDPNTNSAGIAGKLKVEIFGENGLIGITKDPNFSTNHWVYLLYAVSDNGLKQRLARYTFKDLKLDMQSEQILLDIPIDNECCHFAGDLEFDKNGNLFVSIGDNTNPFQSAGFAPIDERKGQFLFDAQRSAGNSMDLRGKILRIHPEENGRYTIPAGNLFTDTAVGRPEIYVMGVRNPFRIAIDTLNNELFWGDVGPDAPVANANRGAKGVDEINRTTKAGNFGWPYCLADGQPYVDFDFSRQESKGFFDCDTLLNNSPNNTGQKILPPAQPAWIWYPEEKRFPEFTNTAGRSIMAGAIYHFDSLVMSPHKFPEYYDNSLFVFDWSNSYFREIKMDTNNQIININPFLKTIRINRPVDMDFGPDGTMYVMEWGRESCCNNEDARIIKISFQTQGRSPIAKASVIPDNGNFPLKVDFSAHGTYDPDSGDYLTYSWDFDGDGVFDMEGITAQYTFNTPGVYQAKLKVDDRKGKQAFVQRNIVVGNNRPNVTVLEPVKGGIYTPGDKIAVKVNVADLEEGSTNTGEIDCSDVWFVPAIGHNDHSHSTNRINGCEGTFISEEHGEEKDRLYYEVSAFYEDKGKSMVPALIGSSNTTIYPNVLQAEHFDRMSGIDSELSNDFMGGYRYLESLHDGDYISFRDVNLKDIKYLTYRLNSSLPGGYIEIRLDSVKGTLIHKQEIPQTSTWDYVTSGITPHLGTHDLFFVFHDTYVNGQTFYLNWIEFHGKGIAVENRKANFGLNGFYFENNNINSAPKSL